MGIHHKPNRVVPGADVVVLVCVVVKLLFSAFRRRRKRSCNKNVFTLTRVPMVYDDCKKKFSHRPATALHFIDSFAVAFWSLHHYQHVSQDSAVGIATGYGLDN
jgi:hypothetical protein